MYVLKDCLLYLSKLCIHTATLSDDQTDCIQEMIWVQDTRNFTLCWLSILTYQTLAIKAILPANKVKDCTSM